jgi:hypothetical protein
MRQIRRCLDSGELFLRSLALSIWHYPISPLPHQSIIVPSSERSDLPPALDLAFRLNPREHFSRS